MRKTILALVLSLIFIPAAAFAHPPTSVSAAYDKAKSILSVRVTHATGDRKTHYLRTVSVYKNGDLLKEFSYQWQKNRVTVTEDLSAVLQEGDVVKVVAADNGGGVQESVISF